MPRLPLVVFSHSAMGAAAWQCGAGFCGQPVRSCADRREERAMWRFFRVAALATALLIALGVYFVMDARCFAIGMPAICRVETDRPRVALSFDDGPTQRGLDAILPELERRHRLVLR
jgi:hypothetical protein